MLMKKYLLVAVAALVAVSVNAQSLQKGISGKPHAAKTIAKGELKSFDKDMKITSVRSSAATQTRKVEMFNMNVSSLKSVNEIKNATAIRRAGTVQSSYNGSGTNYQTKESATWKMLSGTAEDGTPLLADVIPLPENWASLGNIAVKYSLSGSTITIAPQVVVSGQAQDGSTIYYMLHSWASDNGSIVLTLGEDGSLTTIDGEDIAYSAFSSETFDLSKDGPYLGLVLDIEKVKYRMEGEVVIPVASYQPQTLFLHAGPNVNGNYYTNLMMPAYANIELANRTDMECDTYAWTAQTAKYDGGYVEDGDPIIGTEKDFTFFSEDKTFFPVSLVSTLAGQASEPFKWNRSVWYAGSSADGWDDGESPKITMCKANPDGGLSIINPAGTKSIIAYQGKPASALYFTGTNLFVYKFEQTEGQELALTCKIHKAHRDPVTGKFSLGELIAQADVNAEVERGTWMEANNLVRLNWDSFYREDEDGMTEDVPYLLLDEEFALVFEGWNNGTFSGSPLVFNSVSAGGFSNTYAILPDQETYVRSGWSGTFDVFAGFQNAVYGYLYTEDSKDITIPVEGGQASIKVHPMYSNTNADENGSKTRLFLDQTVADNDIPEWLQIGFANEDYDENYTFDLVFQADALPAGVEGRQATITFMQEGARLEVTVTQGTVTGINVTTKTVKTSNSPAYNLAGQRVNKDFKGLVVKDGVKFMNK